MPQIDVRLYEQCLATYKAMLKVSTPHPEQEGVHVFTGFTTYLIESIGLSISNYTPVMRRLQGMGCIRQLIRGGRGIPSVWVLLKDPCEEDFTRAGQRWKRDQDRIAELEARVDELEHTLYSEEKAS